MKLFTKEILKKLPTLDESALLSISEQKVWVKLFQPSYGFYWYITAYNPQTNEAFGFVNLGDSQCAELGYISINEIVTAKYKIGQVERDKYFDPMPLQEVMDIVHAGKHV